jgi:hypothetical protein
VPARRLKAQVEAAWPAEERDRRAITGCSRSGVHGATLRDTRTAYQRARSVLEVSRDAQKHAAISRLSRVLFGQEHRLAVMIAIARSDGLFCQQDLVAQLGLPAPSSIQGPLRDLRLAGLVQPLPDLGTRKVWLRRQESLAWDWVLELDEAVERQGHPMDSDSRPRASP